MLNLQQAEELLRKYVNEPGLVKHSLASGAVLRELAYVLKQDEELWAITGLLHDLDYEQTKDQPEKHGLIAAELLAGKLPEESLYAIKAHNSEFTRVEPKSQLDFALRCGETVTGLILAAAYVRPTKFEGMKPKSLKKKMKDKSFAASVNRDIIKECEKLSLSLDDFLNIAIRAMQSIANQL